MDRADINRETLMFCVLSVCAGFITASHIKGLVEHNFSGVVGEKSSLSKSVCPCTCEDINLLAIPVESMNRK